MKGELFYIPERTKNNTVYSGHKFFCLLIFWERMNFKYYIPHRYKNTFKLGFKTAFMLFIFWLPYSIIVRFCNIEIINSILTFILGYYMMFVCSNNMFKNQVNYFKQQNTEKDSAKEN